MTNTTRPQTVCIVTPCYNEQDVVDLFYRRLREALATAYHDSTGQPAISWRLIFVDDGSHDGTLERINQLAAEDSRVFVYSLSRNFGHQIALTAGLAHARADAVVMMDCDLQHPPEMLPNLIAAWRGGAEIVSAVRLSTADASWSKQWLSRAFYGLINRISDVPIIPGAADFCLLSRRAHQAILAMPERHRFLRGMIGWIGFRRVFLSYHASPRAAGESKYTLGKMWRLAATAVISFSATPLKMATRTGIMTTLLGIFYLTYVLGRYLCWGDLVPGWASLICTVLILGGMQLFSIGLVGEYLARVFEEAKRRPLYFFKQEPEVPPSAWDDAHRGETNRAPATILPALTLPVFVQEPLIR